MAGALALAGWSCERSPTGSPATAGPPPIQRTQHTHSGDAFLGVAMTIDKAELTVADRVRLTLDCTTRAGAELVLPEFGPTLGDFTVVSADTRRRPSAAGGRETLAVLVLEPFLAGDKTIPPIPVRVIDAGRTLSLRTEPATLKVAAVAGADATDNTPLEPAKAPVALIALRRTNHLLIWTISGCSALAILAAFAFVAVASSRRTRRQADPAFRVRRRFEQLRTTLARASTSAEASAAAEDLFRALAEYLRDAWSIPADTQPHARIAPLIASLESMPLEQRTELSRLLIDLERARFAPDAAGVPIIRSLLDRAGSLVDRTIPLSGAEGHA